MSDVEDLAAAHGAEVVSSPLAPRGRRAGRDAAAAAADKFARLRERRRAPGSASSARRLAEYDDIYDEVTEDHYNAIVKGRLKEEDFVVDDDGRGYAENGLEEWDDVREDEYSTGSEAEVEKRRRSDRKGPRKRFFSSGAPRKRGNARGGVGGGFFVLRNVSPRVLAAKGRFPGI
ncbi:MAG: DNA polymerase alpha subunit p180 N terminal-domain-containing protein [Olpidium bornovanus]|uniref:DNA polymerase alpha subunit p180 N terminal-domain-containing protein n=1 Tax=Olpidium bornovanus TaxID=278681 RepID=A0A8H7ZKJ4_9FUNG|nr:MAG: DNA polymerase alpha subunit p180 N terminal-domain-containing protein [Olpidium bornovanus]